MTLHEEAFAPRTSRAAPANTTEPQVLTTTAQERLRQLITRIETLEEEKAGISADIKEVYGEAKSTGFDVKVMRKVVALRKVDRAERSEQQQVLDLYLAAMGEV